MQKADIKQGMYAPITITIAGSRFLDAIEILNEIYLEKKLVQLDKYLMAS